METTYPVDRVHSGIRFVSLALVALAMVLSVLFVTPLLRRAGLSAGVPLIVSFFAGLLAGGALSYAAERWLPRLWPSGRAIHVSDEGMTLATRGEAGAAIRWDDPVDVLAWAFVVPTRRAWVPRGWYCAAFRLQQGDDLIIPYTFLKPGDAEALPGWESFAVLIPRKDGKQEGGDAIYAGQAALRRAEGERWWAGVEVSAEDFARLLTTARTRTRRRTGAGATR